MGVASECAPLQPFDDHVGQGGQVDTSIARSCTVTACGFNRKLHDQGVLREPRLPERDGNGGGTARGGGGGRGARVGRYADVIHDDGNGRKSPIGKVKDAGWEEASRFGR